MYCRKCGALLRETDKYCSQCASPVEEESEQAPAEELRPRTYAERVADGTFEAASVTDPEQLNEVRFGQSDGLPEEEILYPGEQFDHKTLSYAAEPYARRRARTYRSDLKASAEAAQDQEESVKSDRKEQPPASYGKKKGKAQKEDPLYDERLYRDRFVDRPEEGSHALLTTVLILLVIVVLAALFLVGYFLFRKSAPASPQGQSTALTEEAEEGNLIVIMEEGGEEAEGQAQTQAPAESETALREEAAAADPEALCTQMEEILTQRSTAQEATVYVYDLMDQTEYACAGAEQPMFASATISVPILYTAATMLDGGQLTLNDQITYVDSVGGRGEPNPQERDGKPYPLSYYLTTMLSYSDNNCMNCLIDRIGLEEINRVCHNAGYESTDLQRKIVADVTDGKENYLSARDMALMVKEIYNGKFRTIGRDFMQQYFRVGDFDESGSVLGNAPSLPENGIFLNQNGRGDTRYSEVAVVADETHAYVIAVMLTGEYGFAFDEAVTEISELVYQQLGRE